MDITTLILILIFAAVCFSGLRKESDYFFDLKYTTVWKGICCVVVVLVHIPVIHGNKVQDLVGSFGYICVTLFFLFSGYGLRWSLSHKNSYLTSFVRNRFAALLVPFILINILYTLAGCYFSHGSVVGFDIALGFFGLKNFSFVHVLLLFYTAFFLIYKYVNLKVKYQDILMCIFVLAYSMLGGFFNFSFGWYVESLGFLYGMLCFYYVDFFKFYIKKQFIVKISIAIFLSTVFGLLYINFKTIDIYGSYILRIVLGIIIILSLFLFTAKYRFENTLIKFLGIISYEVFLSHGLIMFLISKIIIEKFAINLSSGIFIVLTFLVTIIFSYFMHRFDSKILTIIK